MYIQGNLSISDSSFRYLPPLCHYGLLLSAILWVSLVYWSDQHQRYQHLAIVHNSGGLYTGVDVEIAAVDRERGLHDGAGYRAWMGLLSLVGDAALGGQGVFCSKHENWGSVLCFGMGTLLRGLPFVDLEGGVRRIVMVCIGRLRWIVIVERRGFGEVWRYSGKGMGELWRFDLLVKRIWQIVTMYEERYGKIVTLRLENLWIVMILRVKCYRL